MMKSMRARQLTALAAVLVTSFSLNPLAHAETDKEIQERTLKQREMFKEGADADHSKHIFGEEKGKYRGVFFGYLPCKEDGCSGIKMTLSLNAKNNYTLVIQPARFRNRESFEKGLYVWDEANRLLTMTPYKTDLPVRKLTIKDEGTLIHLDSDGRPFPGDQKPYQLERSDQADNREMHIH